MAHRRWRWLILAGLLFGAAALFMSVAGQPKPLPPRVKMPRGMDSEAYQRLDRRRTLPALPTAKPKPVEEWGPPRKPRLADPVLRALPAEVKNAALVFEANALRYSPVGQLLLDCFTGAAGDELLKMKSKTGVDPLVDLDRVGVFDGTLIVSGRFAEARWPEMFKGRAPVALNDHTKLWEEPSTPTKTLATWKDEMVIVGSDRRAVEEVVARLEGTAAPIEKPLLDERESYGEIYGAISPDALSGVLAKEQPALAEHLRQVVSSIRVHVDASHDVGIVFDAKGGGPDTTDFGKAVGAALVMGRLAALTRGDKTLAEVLDYARVQPKEGGGQPGFRTELALPLTFFQDKLRDCKKLPVKPGERSPGPVREGEK
jgi:hypothetical protein